MLLAIVLRLIYFRGVHLIDDFNYLRHAGEIWQGRFDITQVLYWHGMRPVIFIPVAGCFSLFGVSQSTAVLWPFVLSVLTVGLVVLIGSRLGGTRTGIFAGIVAAFCPMAVDEATRLLPGEIQNFLIAAAVYAFLRSETSERARSAWLLAAGATFALMPWTGHLGLVAGVFFVLAILLHRRHSLWSYAPVAVGAAIVLIAAHLYQWVAAGNPFLSAAVLHDVLSRESAPADPFYYAHLAMAPLLSHGGVLFLALVGVVFAIERRWKPWGMIALWLLATAIVLEFGTTSLTEYRPVVKQPRYFSVLAIPAALLSGLALEEILTIVRSKVTKLGMVLAGAILAATFVTSIMTIDRVGNRTENRDENTRGVAEWVELYQGRPIYVMHWVWNTRIGFFTDYADDYFPSGFDPYSSVLLETADPTSLNRYVQTLEPGEMMPAGLLVVDERLLGASRRDGPGGFVRAGELPEVLFDPPSEWRLLQPLKGVVLYDVPDGVWPGG